jgi:hypothetical protein
MAQDAQDDDDGYGRWRRRSSGTGRHYSGKEVRRRLCGAMVLENVGRSSTEVERRGQHDGGER